MNVDLKRLLRLLMWRDGFVILPLTINGNGNANDLKRLLRLLIWRDGLVQRPGLR